MSKSMGSFIAALRKADGMTQRELADRLNVSDKTVSRWEREDGAPDLALIPVIAEIFGVTCDELLRGERKSAALRETEPVPDEPTPLGERQRRRLLASTAARYRSRSFIALGVAAAGLITAAICNGFTRGLLGFLLGLVFYLAAAVCQAIFLNNAFLSVSEESLPCGESAQFRSTAISGAKKIYAALLVLIAFTLPLAVFPWDAYSGLSFDSWVGYGLLFAAITLAVCGLVCFFINPALLRRDLFTPSSGESAYRANRRKKFRWTGVLAILTVVTVILCNMVTGGGDSGKMAIRMGRGQVFDEYDRFVYYMELERDPVYNGAPGTSVEQVEPDDFYDQTYYDEYGNVLSKEEYLDRYFRVDLTDKNGDVVCSFLHLNGEAVYFEYEQGDGTVLPITVLGEIDLTAGRNMVTTVNALFVLLWCIELLAVVLLYRKNRVR